MKGPSTAPNASADIFLAAGFLVAGVFLGTAVMALVVFFLAAGLGFLVAGFFLRLLGGLGGSVLGSGGLAGFWGSCCGRCL